MPTTTSTTSWLAKRLLTALPALFLLFTSCEEPTDIGLNDQPDSQLGVNYLEYTAIGSSTVLLDSALETTGGNVQLNHLVGYINDPVFGKVTAKTYAELRLNNTGVTFTGNVVVDSVEMKLDYKGAYGLTDEPLTIKVHELTQNINPDSAYYTKDRRTYDATALGTHTFTPSDLKPTTASPKYVRFQLAKTFGERIIDLGRNGNIIDDHSEFRQAIKGIAIVPETGNGGRSVATLGFEKDADSSFVRIWYKQNGERRNIKLYLDRATRRFHSIDTDRAGTMLSQLQANADTIVPVSAMGYKETYIQAGSGIRTVLRFPGLENLREQLGAEIAINKAELIIPVVGGSATEYAPPSFLTLTDARGYRRIDTTSAGNPSYIGGDAAPTLQQLLRYDSNKGQYTAQLGTYLQSVLYGKRANKGMVVSSTSNSVQVNRARLPIAGPAGIKLRIYYTKVL